MIQIIENMLKNGYTERNKTMYDNFETPHLEEIQQQEFYDHIEDDDFFLAYGNPVIINCDNGKSLAAIAWPLAERMLRSAGRGEEAYMQMKFSNSKDFINSDKLEKQKRTNAVVDLYKTGSASLGYCADMLDISIGVFIKILGKNKISIFHFENDDDFLNEIKKA